MSSKKSRGSNPIGRAISTAGNCWIATRYRFTVSLYSWRAKEILFSVFVSSETTVSDGVVSDSSVAAVSSSGLGLSTTSFTTAAQAQGCTVGFDLAHAAGNLPLQLHAWGPDFAVWCGYKYLNGGPGAPAFLYVNKPLQNDVSSPIWGWWGQRDPFAFDLDYQPAPGVQRFLVGTAPMLSMLAMDAGAAIKTPPDRFVRTANYYLKAGTDIPASDYPKLAKYDLLVFPAEAQVYNRAMFAELRRLNRLPVYVEDHWIEGR